MRRPPAPPSRALWRCAHCGRTFANRNQTHTCAKVRALDEHFAGKPERVRALFDRILAVVKSCGPVTVLPEKTRIAFHVRMSFMAIQVQRTGLRGHFVFAAVERHPRFTRVESFSARNHLHAFRVGELAEIDRTFESWVARAYAVGEQRHRLSGPFESVAVGELRAPERAEPPRRKATRTASQKR